MIVIIFITIGREKLRAKDKTTAKKSKYKCLADKNTTRSYPSYNLIYNRMYLRERYDNMFSFISNYFCCHFQH